MVLSEYQDVINTIHLNSENCLVLHPHKSFSYFKNNIVEEIEVGIKYGIKRYVLHMNKWKFNVKNRQEKYISMIIENLKELSIELNKYDVDIFIENLYEPLPFYEELFKEVYKSNLNRIHHTFDFGHAKVWGEYNIDDYFNYLKKLKYDYQRKFHFHVHTNNGLFDEHKSFLEGLDTHRNEIDGFYLINNDIETYVIEFIKEFKEDTFVMEMITEEQIRNYNYLKDIFKKSL